MEEENKKRFSKSSERSSSSEEVDPLALFIPQLPSDYSEDAFTALVGGYGKRAVRNVRLVKKPQSRQTYAFANFLTAQDALDAKNALHDKPPLHLTVLFAKKKNDHKVSSSNENVPVKGRGRGKDSIAQYSTGEKEFSDSTSPTYGSKSNVNINNEYTGFPSKGRGQRISLESPVSRIRVVADGVGRKVTVDDSAFKKSEPDLDSISKGPNPFYFCFVCGQEGTYSCKHCRKPYCSKNCQILDFPNHKEICKRAKDLAEKLLCLYKNFPAQNFDSGVSESSNSDPEKSELTFEAKPEILQQTQVHKTIEKLVLSCADVELVNIINIESPSKFWIHLKKYSLDFCTMEDKLTSLQKSLKHFHNQLCVSPQLHCCTLYNSKICRAKVLKVKSQNEILIDLLDYGKTVTVQKTSLCSLPIEFRNLPAQAITCRLVSDDNEIIQWDEEDTLSFELHTSNKTYKAHVFNCSNDVYDVSLINNDGIPLYTILAEEKKTARSHLSTKASLHIPETDEKPPTVWSLLKPHSKMFLIPTVLKGDFLWCYLVVGESDLKQIAEVEKLLQNYSGEDMTLTAEEDDFSAGFSNEYKQYYRCRILRRRHKSFLVHFIDYGNEEEIMQLKVLSEELLQKYCYLVKCEKPSDLSILEFQKFLGNSGAEVTVLEVGRNLAKLSFHYNKKHSVNCYPCYSNYLFENGASDIEAFPVRSKNTPASIDKEVPMNVNEYKVTGNRNSLPKVSSPLSYISPALKPKKSFENIKDYEIASEKITVPRALLPSTNYSVRVLFIKTVSEIYVQLTEDEIEMNKMMKSLNIFCNSEKSCYIPNTGEIVSCKFRDDMWYRGKVLGKIKNGYRIFFIDYGNEDVVSQNDVQILSDKFIFPQFSICVSLSEIKNEDISKSLLSRLLSEDWNMKVVDLNKTPVEVMLFQKDIPITKMIENKTNNIKSNLKFQKLPVKSTIKICFEDDKYLYVNQIKDLKSLKEMSDKLNSTSDLPLPKFPKINNVYSGLFSDGLFYRVSIEEIISSVSYKVYFLDFGNYHTVKATDLRELPSDLFALPVYCIPVQIQNRKEVTLNMDDDYTVEVIGMQEDVQIVKFIGLDVSSNLKVVNEAKSNTKDKSFLSYKKLPGDAIVDVKISYMDSKLVYVHQVSDLQSVEDICVKLNNLTELIPVVNPIINKVYCGLCSDGYWYRVSLEEITSNTYKVYFLDFGNYEDLLADNLKELPSDLFPIPVCCIPVLVENRKELALKIEEQHKIKVTGNENNFQKVRFVDYQKDDSLYIVNENEDVEKTKNKIEPEKAEKLPHISSLKKQKLKDGLSEVIFCHLDGDIIYCQLSSDNECIINMFKKIQKCSNEGKTPASISVGDVVCAQSSDACWYRACILCDKKAPLYKVLFFDYGNAESVTRDCIKIIPNEFLSFPVFAIPMKIENAHSITDNTIYTKPMLIKKIKEINGDTYIVEFQLEENTNHPKISTLKRLTLPDDVVSNVTVCHTDNSLYYVQPTSNIDNFAKLSNMLLKADTFCGVLHTPEEGDIICAKFIDNVWYRCAVKKVLPDKIEVCFIDFGNSDSISVDNIKILPLELCSYSIGSIPIKFKNEQIAQHKLSENIFTFNVKVCNVIDNIQVVDIVSQADLTDKPKTVQLSYTPIFLSSFTESSLALKETSKVIFKKKINNLYIVLKLDDCHEIEKLKSLLQESKSDVISHLPSVNEVLLAKKSDSWYRCSVLSIISEDVYKIYFVDLGITEDVQKGSMRSLPDVCKTYPLFAIKMSVESDEPIILDNCYNIHVLNKNSDDIYSAKVYHQYKYSSIGRKELIPMEESSVMFCHKEGEKLFLQRIEDAEILAEVQKLLEDCLSNSCMPYKPDVGELVCAMSQLDKSYYRGCIEEVLKWDQYKVHFIDYGNSENVQIKYLQPISPALGKFPSLSIPVKFVNKEIMKRIELEKEYRVVADSKASNGVQIVRLVENHEVVPCTELKTNSVNHQSSDACKKFLFSSCKFVPFNSGEQDIVIYNVDEEGYIYCAPFDSDNIQANLNLLTLITEHCNSSGLPFNNSQPQPGEMVLALYSVDKSWYRAVIVENSHPDYEVNFVDYGNSDCLNIKCLRKMEEKFMKLDVQAHMCSLGGVTFPDENSGKVVNELKKFDMFSYEKPLRADVKIIDGEITVNIPVITSHLLEQKLVTVVAGK